MSFAMGLLAGDVKAATKSLEKDDLIEAEEALFDHEVAKFVGIGPNIP